MKPELNSQRGHKSSDHGRHLAPGIDPPPEPAQQIDEPRPGPERDDELPGVGDRAHEESDDRGQKHEQHGRKLRDGDIVLFTPAANEKPPVEVIDQVAGSPVELGSDRGHIGGGEGGDHQPAERHREVGHDDPDVAGLGVGGKRRVVIELDDRDQSDQDPRPGPEGVVSQVEPEGGQERMFLILGAKDALGDETAASRFGSRVPGGPPVDGDIDKKGDERHPGGVYVRDEREERTGRSAAPFDGMNPADEPAYPPDRLDGKYGEQDDHTHFEYKLEQIGNKDAPQPAQGRNGRRYEHDDDGDNERLELA